MSPRETTNPRPSAFSQLLVATTGQRKSSLRGSKEKLVRVTSPLTPWEDTLLKKRKSSLKGNSRQLKALKSNSKEHKKKNKKEIDKSLEIKLRSDGGKSKIGKGVISLVFLYVRHQGRETDCSQEMAE